jgi:protein-tyrosine phosphatase
VDSAGTWTQPGLPIDPLAQKTAKAIGLDLRNHRTRSIGEIVPYEYDLIIAMERDNKEALNAEFPECEGRIHLLTQLAGETEDRPDPFGEDLSFHVRMANELIKLINIAYTNICELAVA